MLRKFVFSAVVACIGVAACGKDSTAPTNPDPATGTVVQLKGAVATITYSGEVDISIAATATGGSAAITGCVYLESPTCLVVTGNYTVASKSMTFSIPSPALTFVGNYDAGVAEGPVSGSGGSGFWSTRTGSVSVFCGSFTGTVDGTWNTVVTTSAVSGVFVNEFGGSGVITGTRTGNNVSASTDNGLTATGTISGTSASGNWTLGTDNGTWSGTTADCR
jgi:hypothetical protein